MKKNLWFLMAVLCIALSGCAKEYDPDDLDTEKDYLLNSGGDKPTASSGIVVTVPGGSYSWVVGSTNPNGFSGADILWYNETTKELRFKDNFAVKDILSGASTYEFYIAGEYMFTITYLTPVSSQVVNSLVLYYNAIENKFFLTDGYPDVSFIGGFISYETSPGIFIEVVATPEIIQALRDENMKKMDVEWNLFMLQLKNEGKLKDELAHVRSKFLVDKIYDYNDYLVAEYFYDNLNRLKKKSVTQHLGYPMSEWGGYTDEFVYQNGRVSKIMHKDISNNILYETHIFYNSHNQLIRSEMHNNGFQLTRAEYRYENGRVAGHLSNSEFSDFIVTDTMVYNDAGNISQHIFISRKQTDLGEPIPETAVRRVDEYKYDNHPKPTFGIDYLFVYDPLPFHEEAQLQRRLSINNMTEFIGGSKWMYTYNENGLPSTIEIKWGDVVTVQPMLLKIKYKQAK